MTGKKPTIDVDYIANLAKLKIDESSMPKFQKDMEHIVKYVDLIGELDLEGVEPTAHPVDLTNIWREDVAKDSFPQETMLNNAPAIVEDELIRVPQVITGGETE